MIQVHASLIPITADMPYGKGLRYRTANLNAERYVKIIEETIKDKKCPLGHPDNGTIVVVAEKEEFLRVDKTGLCCRAFSDSLSFDFSR